MEITIFWFRRDLRLSDNHGLYQAFLQGRPVLPIFIFDIEILEVLPSREDTRVMFIHKAIEKLQSELPINQKLAIFHGKSFEVFTHLFSSSKFKIKAVCTNEDYEPYAISRDEKIKNLATIHQADFLLFKDHVIFHKNEIVKPNRTPYTVYTPYSKTWLGRFTEEDILEHPSQDLLDAFHSHDFPSKISLKELGFKETYFPSVEPLLELGIIKNYSSTRNIPAVAGISKISVHLRFGTISIREVFRKTQHLNLRFWKELIWRDFFISILYHFPFVVYSEFKPKYSHFPWNENDQDFEAWKQGKTGYPLVDAGMRELLHTGFMHNRVRMLTASFLIKHLKIDWKKGEAWFAEKLLDFDLAQNNGNWQWVAGTGVDASPYYRVFSPKLQQEKFDPDFIYCKKWIPELGTSAYPDPIVDHATARREYLELMKTAP